MDGEQIKKYIKYRSKQIKNLWRIKSENLIKLEKRNLSKQDGD